MVAASFRNIVKPCFKPTNQTKQTKEKRAAPSSKGGNRNQSKPLALEYFIPVNANIIRISAPLCTYPFHTSTLMRKADREPRKSKEWPFLIYRKTEEIKYRERRSCSQHGSQALCVCV